MSTTDHIRDEYVARATGHLSAATAARRLAGRLSAGRLVTAIGAIALAGGAWERQGRAATAMGVAATAAALLFLALVGWHRRATASARRHELLRRVAVDGASRVVRRWDELPPPPAWAAPLDALPIGRDLDLAGRVSLTRLFDVVTPALGGAHLARTLLDVPGAGEIAERQRAVAELARDGALLEALAANARAGRRLTPTALDALTTWAVAPPWLARHRALHVAAFLLPLATLTAIVAASLGADAPREAVFPLLVVTLALASLARAPLGAGLESVEAALEGVRAARRSLEALAARPSTSPRLTAIAEGARAGGGAPALARLERLLAWASVRHAPMANWGLDALLAWDVHLLAAVERWRTRSGSHLAGWLDALAEAEALAALATLAHDHPEWPFPEVDDAAPALIDAAGLAHPLLPASRVGNDVALVGEGSLLVVTGSNMAGKSTLLRAVGVNVLLAMSGAPVCARRLRLRRLEPWTSMRVHDALADGISLYLAELRRLREVVDAARERRRGVPVLFLLDEVLHGTNSHDRRVATQAILGHLRAAGAAGLVATHDLALADAPGLTGAAAHLHFRETIERGPDGPTMRFDYLARPGKATSANALALLEAMGLGGNG